MSHCIAIVGALISPSPLELLISWSPRFPFLVLFPCFVGWHTNVLPEKGCMRGKVFETLYILRCLYPISYLTGSLAGYRILLWDSFSLEVLTSLLYFFLAFGGAIKKSNVTTVASPLNRIILFSFRKFLGPLFMCYIEVSVWSDFLVCLGCCNRILYTG